MSLIKKNNFKIVGNDYETGTKVYMYLQWSCQIPRFRKKQEFVYIIIKKKKDFPEPRGHRNGTVKYILSHTQDTEKFKIN